MQKFVMQKMGELLPIYGNTCVLMLLKDVSERIQLGGAQHSVLTQSALEEGS